MLHTIKISMLISAVVLFAINSFAQPSCNLNSVQYSDQNTIYVTGEQGIFKSGNSGLSFKVTSAVSQDGDKSELKSTVHFFNRTVSVGKNGLILVSKDNDGLFVKAITKVPVNLNSVYALDEMNYIAVGDRGVIIRSEDGGLTWSFLR